MAIGQDATDMTTHGKRWLFSIWVRSDDRFATMDLEDISITTSSEMSSPEGLYPKLFTSQHS